MAKIGASFGAVSSKVARMRHQRRSMEPVSNEFTQEGRKEMS